MKIKLMLILPLFCLSLLLSSSLLAVELKNTSAVAEVTRGDLDVSIRLIGGKGAVLKKDRNIELTCQVNKDAYLIIYNIDAEGYIHVLFPQDGKLKLVEGSKIHTLPGSGEYWETGDITGIEYIHVLAVEDVDMIREKELYYLARNSKLPEKERFRIDMDPFLAFNMINDELLEDSGRSAPASDYTYFYVNKRVDYPRFLCYRCHSPNKLTYPYTDDCTEVIVEKELYDEDPDYPYPTLYHVQHVDEEDDDYMYDDYAGNLADVEYYDEGEAGSTTYLSLWYGGEYSPYTYYWPYYGINYGWGYPSWGFGFSFYWGWGGCYYHHYPFNSWCYPYYGYGPYYGCSPYYNACYGPYASAYNAYNRPVYASRSIAKRGLAYRGTADKMKRQESFASSRAVRTREASNRSGTQGSRLARRTALKTNRDFSGARRAGRTMNEQEIQRRVVHGIERSRDAMRTTRKRNESQWTKKARRSSEKRAESIGRSVRKRTVQSKDRDEQRRATRSVTRDKSSRDSGNKTSKSTSRSNSRKSSVRRPSSKGSSSTKKSSPSSRSRSTPSRSKGSSSRSISRGGAPRSSGAARAPSRSGGSAGRSAPSRSSGGGGRRR